MKRALPYLFLCVFLLLCASCTVTTTNLRLDQLNEPGLPENETVDDSTALRARAEGLWQSLEKAKLTTYITKDRIAGYFENEQERSDFIAIYASMFREKRFEREYVQKFQVGKIVIEPNGVLAKVEVTIWGKIYFIWRHRIHEVQTWKKTDGGWMMKPQAS
ncbi:MAG: hypothetical protein GX444_15585 [Myxococcales bacterium]|nr:hypothetical protein [Myxococcales bacterium]